MKNLRRLPPLAVAASLLLCAAAAPGFAQDRAREPDGTIVVEGQAKELRNELKDLLNAPGDQLARFESEFCPKVIGFDAEWTPILETLIRENVAAAGMEVEDSPCTPTAVVIFSYDPQQLMQGLRGRMPGLFEGLNPVQLDRLTDPVQTSYSWRAIDMRSRDGLVLPSAGAINGEPADAKIVRNAKAGRLERNVRFDIVNSYLVLDIERTPGMSLGQIAGFATMHLLLDLSEEAQGAARSDSILRLFDAEDPTAVPQSLSDFDRLTLKGLYEQRQNNLSAFQQRSRIVKTIQANSGQDEALPPE